MLKLLRQMMRTPEAQRDPYQWAATLLAHAFIGVALAALLPWWVPVAAYAGWEAVQWWRFKADPWDCLLDWVAVCLGVCVAIALSADQGAAAACLALALILLVGVRARA